jgi:serine protease Do
MPSTETLPRGLRWTRWLLFPLLAAVLTLPLPAAGQGDVGSANESAWIGRRNAIVQAAEKAGPAVVTVAVLRRQLVTYYDPHQEFFNPFFRNVRPRYWQAVKGLGSGVIVRKDGVILTNFHVVKGAQEIRITLADGREYGARYVGGAELYDLAVLQLVLDDNPIPVADLAQTDDLMIGEWVVAIGNPFGYLLDDPEPTVTVGVVSALGRDILSEREDQETLYKNMIQTDAAINPGNSGGPLVNALGEVVGFNAFIFSKSGGSQGIGFAIPVSTALRVMDEVLDFGAVREVWVGVRVQEIPEALAESLELDSRDGVIVATVDKGSPADVAGIRRGDVIRRIGNDRIRNFEDARRALYGVLVGDRLECLVERNGQTSEHRMDLVERGKT